MLISSRTGDDKLNSIPVSAEQKSERRDDAQSRDRFSEVPYAVFLAGLAAISGCIVAVPAAIYSRDTDLWWKILLMPVVFSGAAFIQGVWSLRAKDLSFRATCGEFNSRTQPEQSGTR